MSGALRDTTRGTAATSPAFWSCRRTIANEENLLVKRMERGNIPKLLDSPILNEWSPRPRPMVE